jgi:hypothetical protein
MLSECTSLPCRNSLYGIIIPQVSELDWATRGHLISHSSPGCPSHGKTGVHLSPCVDDRQTTAHFILQILSPGECFRMQETNMSVCLTFETKETKDPFWSFHRVCKKNS